MTTDTSAPLQPPASSPRALASLERHRRALRLGAGADLSAWRSAPSAGARASIRWPKTALPAGMSLAALHTFLQIEGVWNAAFVN